jgi:putative transposase
MPNLVVLFRLEEIYSPPQNKTYINNSTRPKLEQMQFKSYKCRIYPTKEQEVLLSKTFGCCRFVWNKLVENFNSNNREKITIKTLKDTLEYEFLNEVSATVIHQKYRDFEEFKKQFFNNKRKVKLGRPQFKKKSSRQSFRLLNTRYRIDKDLSKIRFEKIGWIKIILNVNIPDEAIFKSATVSKTPTGKYFISILVQQELNPIPSSGKIVGIDLGIKDLMVLSSGQVVNNPKWFRENQSKLKKAQKHLSRKEKGSNRYNKQRIKVAKVHEYITNSRNYFLHNISTALVNTFDLIVLEDLNVSGMLKNHKLAKSIADASWSTFVCMLEYKCKWYGKMILKIDRFYPSSKTCSNCGHKEDKMPLSIREWTCPSCGSHHDRDLNASINILKEGWRNLTSQELTSAEYVDYGRGAELRLNGASHHLASAVKRLEN